MARVFLAAWLALFGMQASEMLTVIVPDTCAADAPGTAPDDCPETCPRCVCCARLPVFLLTVTAQPSTTTPVRAPIPVVTAAVPSAPPRIIYHVPRTLLS